MPGNRLRRMPERAPDDRVEPEPDLRDLTDATAMEVARFVHFVEPDSEACQELEKAGIDVAATRYAFPTVEVQVSDTEMIRAFLDLEEREYHFIQVRRPAPPHGIRGRISQFRRRQVSGETRPMTEQDGQDLLSMLESTVSEDPRPRIS